MDWKYKVDLINKNVFKEIEKTRGIKIPEELKQFIIDNNAASPVVSTFEVGENERVFEAVLSFNQNESDTYSGYTALELITDNNLFPFGIDPFGNYICYNINRNCIDFLEHETDEVLTTQKNLNDFINSLH